MPEGGARNVNIVEQVAGGMTGGGGTSTPRMQDMPMGLPGLSGTPRDPAENAPQPGAGVLSGGLRGLVLLFE